MIRGNKLKTAKSFFDDVSKEFKLKLEIDNLLVDIACKFINYRVSNQLSQKDLGEKLGFSQSMIHKLESGNYNPSVKLLNEISHKLNWDFRIILDYKNGDDIYKFEEKESKQEKNKLLEYSKNRLEVVA